MQQQTNGGSVIYQLRAKFERLQSSEGNNNLLLLQSYFHIPSWPYFNLYLHFICHPTFGSDIPTTSAHKPIKHPIATTTPLHKAPSSSALQSRQLNTSGQSVVTTVTPASSSGAANSQQQQSQPAPTSSKLTAPVENDNKKNSNKTTISSAVVAPHFYSTPESNTDSDDNDHYESNGLRSTGSVTLSTTAITTSSTFRLPTDKNQKDKKDNDDTKIKNPTKKKRREKIIAIADAYGTPSTEDEEAIRSFYGSYDPYERSADDNDNKTNGGGSYDRGYEDMYTLNYLPASTGGDDQNNKTAQQQQQPESGGNNKDEDDTDTDSEINFDDFASDSDDDEASFATMNNKQEQKDPPATKIAKTDPYLIKRVLTKSSSPSLVASVAGGLWLSLIYVHTHPIP